MKTYFVVVAETVHYGYVVELDDDAAGAMPRARDIAVARLALDPPELRLHNFGPSDRRAVVVSADPALFTSYAPAKDTP
jgi:hypothetical protein